MRDNSQDTIKFILMLGVIVGHVGGNGITDPIGGEPYLSNLIVAVSMPLFFMLSGYHSARTLGSVRVEKFISRVYALLWPLFSFGVIFGLVGYFVSDFPIWKSLAYPFIRIFGGSWFLKTLAECYVISVLTFKFAVSDKWRVLSLALIWICLLFVPKEIGGPLGITTVVHMLPYYVFGALVLYPYEPHKYATISMPIGLVFVLVIAFEGSVRDNGLGFYWVSIKWRDVLLNARGFLCFFARPIVGIMGSIFILWMFRAMDQLFPKVFAALGPLGQTSLGVYVLHEWPLIQLGKHGVRWGGGGMVIYNNYIPIVSSYNYRYNAGAFPEVLLLRRFRED